MPEGFKHGVILGYTLLYKDGTNSSAQWIDVDIPNSLDGDGIFNATLVDLKIYTPYIFKIAGYNYRATGVYSESVTVWTDEFGEL